MSCSKRIIFTFAHPWEPADTFVHPVGIKDILSAGEDLMGICLVADIPDDFIERSIENIMDGNSQLNRSQAGPQVSGIGRDHINNELPDLRAEPGKFFNIQLPEIRRVINICKKVADLWSHLPG